MNITLNKKELVTLLMLIARAIGLKDFKEYELCDYATCTNFQLIKFLKEILANPRAYRIGKNIVSEKYIIYKSMFCD